MKIEKAIEELKTHRDAFYLIEISRDSCDLAISALEKQIELNDYLNTLQKNKKYQIYDILSEFALEVEE